MPMLLPRMPAPAAECQRLSTPPHFTTDFTTAFTADFTTHTGDAPAAHAAAAEWERRSAAAHRSGLLPRAPEAAAPQHLHTQEAACTGLLALLVVHLLYFTSRKARILHAQEAACAGLLCFTSSLLALLVERYKYCMYTQEAACAGYRARGPRRFAC